MPDQPPIISGETPPEDILKKINEELSKEEEETKTFWNSVAQESVKGKINRHLDGAKQIINLNGILLGVYFASISFSSINEHLIIRSLWDIRWIALILLPAIVWALGLWIAIRALEPNSYQYITNDPVLTKERWCSECNSLSKSVLYARLSLVGGFALMIFSFSIYLYFTCDPWSISIYQFNTKHRYIYIEGMNIIIGFLRWIIFKITSMILYH